MKIRKTRAWLLAIAAASFVAQSGLSFADTITYTDIGTFNGEHYLVGVTDSPSGITWQQADAAATASGYELAEVNTAGENNFLWSKVVGVAAYWGNPGPGAVNQLGPWLGGYSTNGSIGFPSNALWSWVDGSQSNVVYTSFGPATWTPGQPDNFESPNGTNGLLFYNGQALGGSGPVGWGDYGTGAALGNPTAFIVETPVPGSLVLLCTGLAGIGAVGWMKRRKVNAVA